MVSFQSRNSIASYAVTILSLMLLATAGRADSPTLSKPKRRTVRGIGSDGNDLRWTKNNNNNGSSSSSSSSRNNLRQRQNLQEPRQLPESSERWFGASRKIQGQQQPEDWLFVDRDTFLTKKAKNDNKNGSLFQATKKHKTGGFKDSTTPFAPSPIDSGSSQDSFVTGPIDDNSNNSNSNTGNKDGDGSSSDSDTVCLAVSSQEPPTTEPLQYVSMTVDVVYEQSDTMSSKDVESHLNEQNLAMALWIAGCEDEATNAMNTSFGKRRELQEWATTAPLITYSQVGSWETTGACVEDDSGGTDGLLESSSPLCQQGFSSTIQLQARENDAVSNDAVSEDLTNIIAQAFGSTSKPALESQQGVVAIAIGDIQKETIGQDSNTVDGLLEADGNQSKVWDNNRNTTIIACSIVGACVFVCMVLLVLIGMYEKRIKISYATSSFQGLVQNDKVAHVPFVDEVDSVCSSDTEDSGIDLILVATENIEGGTPSGGGEDYDDFGLEILPPPRDLGVSPCCHAPRSPAPFDESNERKVCSAATCHKCERQRQEGTTTPLQQRSSRSALIKSIDSSAPVTSVPMNITPNTVISPRIDRRPLAPNATASRRNYALDDIVVL